MRGRDVLANAGEPVLSEVEGRLAQPLFVMVVVQVVAIVADVTTVVADVMVVLMNVAAIGVQVAMIFV